MRLHFRVKDNSGNILSLMCTHLVQAYWPLPVSVTMGALRSKSSTSFGDTFCVIMLPVDPESSKVLQQKEPAFMSIIDLHGNSDSSRSKIDFDFFFFFANRRRLNFGHWESLKIIDVIVVIDGSVHIEEVGVARLAMMVV